MTRTAQRHKGTTAQGHNGKTTQGRRKGRKGEWETGRKTTKDESKDKSEISDYSEGLLRRKAPRNDYIVW